MSKCYHNWDYYGPGYKMCAHCGLTLYATWIEGEGSVFVEDKEEGAPQDTKEKS